MLVLNHLRMLMLDFYRPEADPHFMLFWDRLSAPALKKLTLNLKKINLDENSVHDVPTALAEYYAAGLKSDDLRVTLLHAPSLTRLVLGYCPQCIDDDLLCALWPVRSPWCRKIVDVMRMSEELKRVGFAVEVLRSAQGHWQFWTSEDPGRVLFIFLA